MSEVDKIKYGQVVIYEGMRHAVVSVNENERILRLRPLKIFKKEEFIISDNYDTWVRLENVNYNNVYSIEAYKTPKHEI